MLKKLIKYDIQPVIRIWWILAVAVTGMSAICATVLRLYIEYTARATELEASMGIILSLIMGVTVFATVVAFGAFVLGGSLLCYWRFYKNFFTDEGYLTFSLPIPRRKLYLSKVLNVLIMDAATFLVIMVIGMIFALIVPPTYGEGMFDFVVFRGLGDLMTLLWQGCGGWLIVYILEIILLLVLTALFSDGLVLMCVTIGTIVAKKHKLLAGIGIYYGVSSVITFLGQFVSLFTATSSISYILMMFLGQSSGVSWAGIALQILSFALAEAVLACIFHFTTLGMIERKLNLP